MAITKTIGNVMIIQWELLKKAAVKYERFLSDSFYSLKNIPIKYFFFTIIKWSITLRVKYLILLNFFSVVIFQFTGVVYFVPVSPKTPNQKFLFVIYKNFFARFIVFFIDRTDVNAILEKKLVCSEKFHQVKLLLKMMEIFEICLKKTMRISYFVPFDSWLGFTIPITFQYHINR